jgi:hypothetical protein
VLKKGCKEVARKVVYKVVAVVSVIGVHQLKIPMAKRTGEGKSALLIVQLTRIVTGRIVEMCVESRDKRLWITDDVAVLSKARGGSVPEATALKLSIHEQLRVKRRRRGKNPRVPQMRNARTPEGCRDGGREET